MTDQAQDHAATAPADDLAAAFQIEGWPVRGRIVRLGQTIDTILSAHAYPEPVAALLGEACALAALVGSSLKFLRKTPWARDKVEGLYLFMLREQRRNSSTSSADLIKQQGTD